jgi:hypothetical protein
MCKRVLSNQILKFLELAFCQTCTTTPCFSREQLQRFGKPTWHPFNFGKTRKIGLQQFGKTTWQK